MNSLPSSGVLKASEIAIEFSGYPGDGLTDYYRGGALVHDNHNTDNASIATSGVIKMSQFYGADKNSYSRDLVAFSGYFGIKYLSLTTGDQDPWWYKGNTYTQINDYTTNSYTIGIWGLHPQDYFTSWKTTGTFVTGTGTRTNTTATARNYSQVGGNYTHWLWYATDSGGLNGFIPGNTYTVEVTP